MEPLARDVRWCCQLNQVIVECRLVTVTRLLAARTLRLSSRELHCVSGLIWMMSACLVARAMPAHGTLRPHFLKTVGSNRFFR